MFADLAIPLLRPHRLRKLVPPLPRTRRVDDETAVASTLVARYGKIEPRAPCAGDDLRVARGVAARPDRPEHVLQIEDIDVRIDDDHEPPRVRRRRDLPTDEAGLGRVPRVRLLDRDHHEQTVA